MAEFNATMGSELTMSAELSTGPEMTAEFESMTQVPTTADHAVLFNRDKPDQHPIEAITGLPDALDGKQEQMDALSNTEIEQLLGRFV